MQPIPISRNLPAFLIPWIEGMPAVPLMPEAEASTLKKAELYQLPVSDPAATFVFKVGKDDDTMMDANIPPKSWLIVNRAKSPKASSSDIVIAIVGGKFVVRRLYKHQKVVRLLSENQAKAYPPVELSNHQVFVIWGVVEHVIIPCN
jgi:DNA polymerase V